MKKRIVIILILLFILGLTGCGSKINQDSSDPEAYAFEAQYIRTNGYSEGRSYPYHVVIDSKKELEAYYEANKDLFYLERKEKVYADTTIGFLDACDKYDDAYFERQNLVLIVLEEGSGSIRHKITDVRRRYDENGVSLGWNITIKSTAPEIVTDDMAQWHLFLEVQMGKVIKDGDDVWINDKPSGNNAMTYEVPVEWLDFIKLDGISYLGDWQMTELSAEQIGEKIGEVSCGVPKVYTDGAGNVSSMEPEDGASFLCAIGTEIFEVKGNEHVIAAFVNGNYYLYVSRDYSAGFVGDKLYVVVNGILRVYERYEPGIGELTTKTVLGSFETETEMEGIVWDVYSTEEHPDLSYVLVISGTNASWTYQISDK